MERAYTCLPSQRRLPIPTASERTLRTANPPFSAPSLSLSLLSLSRSPTLSPTLSLSAVSGTDAGGAGEHVPRLPRERRLCGGAADPGHRGPGACTHTDRPSSMLGPLQFVRKSAREWQRSARHAPRRLPHRVIRQVSFFVHSSCISSRKSFSSHSLVMETWSNQSQVNISANAHVHLPKRLSISNRLQRSQPTTSISALFFMVNLAFHRRT